MGDHKPSKEVPWDSYKKDKDLDAKLKRNRDFLRVKKYQRQFSRGTAPIRYRGETPLVSTSRKFAAIRAVVTGDVKAVPFQCSVVKSFVQGDRSATKNKVLAELPIAQQLELLKKRNKVRDVVSDDEESEEEPSEEEKVEIPPLKKEASEASMVKERLEAKRSSKVNVLKVESSDSEEEVQKEKKVAIVERRNSKVAEHSVSLQAEKSKPKEKEKEKEKEKAKEVPKKKEEYSTRKPVRLKLDTVSEEFTHVKIGKLDRMTKLMQSRDSDAPYSKRTDATRLDDVLTKWTLKAV